MKKMPNERGRGPRSNRLDFLHGEIRIQGLLIRIYAIRVLFVFFILLPAEATAVLFSASSLFFSVNTVTDKPLHLA